MALEHLNSGVGSRVSRHGGLSTTGTTTSDGGCPSANTYRHWLPTLRYSSPVLSPQPPCPSSPSSSSRLNRSNSSRARANSLSAAVGLAIHRLRSRWALLAPSRSPRGPSGRGPRCPGCKRSAVSEGSVGASRTNRSTSPVFRFPRAALRLAVPLLHGLVLVSIAVPAPRRGSLLTPLRGRVGPPSSQLG